MLILNIQISNSAPLLLIGESSFLFFCLYFCVLYLFVPEFIFLFDKCLFQENKNFYISKNWGLISCSMRKTEVLIYTVFRHTYDQLLQFTVQWIKPVFIDCFEYFLYIRSISHVHYSHQNKEVNDIAWYHLGSTDDNAYVIMNILNISFQSFTWKCDECPTSDMWNTFIH